MDAVEKDLESRRENIKKEVKFLFKANMKFTDWDVPEADDEKAARLLLDIIKEALKEIEDDINNGKYKNY
jgi:uncharacterized protein YecE (DUF72 family)